MSLIPRILHLYWGKDRPLSWLRYMTVASFASLNPGWDIVVWYPHEPGAVPQWRTREHDIGSAPGTPDWFPRLAEIGPQVSLQQADMEAWPALAEVHRSDLWRWHIMSATGGWWSDFDILYFRPMTALDDRLDPDADVLLCPGETQELRDWHAIGFLAGRAGNRLFADMYALGCQLITAPYLAYQDLGELLLKRFCLPGQHEVRGEQIGRIPQTAVYPFKEVRSQYRALWRDGIGMMDIRPCTVGVHWYGGQPRNAAEEQQLMGEDGLRARKGGVGWVYRQLLGWRPDRGVGIEAKDDLGPIRYSILMPYIARQAPLWNTLVSYEHYYGQRGDWEVIIALDIKAVPRDAEAIREMVVQWQKRGLSLRLIEAGAHDEYNPSRLFNAAARAARGEYLVITSPEVLHRADVLAGFDMNFSQQPDSYVVCACQDWELQGRRRIDQLSELRGRRRVWFQHSLHRPAFYHFCAAMSRHSWEHIGGFDEDYARGYCFDDDDFRQRVQEAGLKIVARDDLLTVHQQHQSTAPGDHGEYMRLWERNRDLYERKWGPYHHLPSPVVK